MAVVKILTLSSVNQAGLFYMIVNNIHPSTYIFDL